MLDYETHTHESYPEPIMLVKESSVSTENEELQFLESNDE